MRAVMTYLIILDPTQAGFSAYSPDLDGCGAAGDDRDEDDHAAEGCHLEGLAAVGESLPVPSSEPAYVEVTT